MIVKKVHIRIRLGKVIATSESISVPRSQVAMKAVLLAVASLHCFHGLVEGAGRGGHVTKEGGGRGGHVTKCCPGNSQLAPLWHSCTPGPSTHRDAFQQHLDRLEGGQAKVLLLLLLQLLADPPGAGDLLLAGLPLPEVERAPGDGPGPRGGLHRRLRVRPGHVRRAGGQQHLGALGRGAGGAGLPRAGPGPGPARGGAGGPRLWGGGGGEGGGGEALCGEVLPPRGEPEPGLVRVSGGNTSSLLPPAQVTWAS